MNWDFSLEKLINMLILVPVLVLSMIVHEICHAFVAYRLGDPTAKRLGRLSFNPIRHMDPLGTAMFFITYLLGGFIFGWAKPVPISPYYFKNRQRSMALVGLAGPVSNFILGIGFILIYRALNPSPDGYLAEALLLAFQVNMVLGLFNLIPIPPLDGSRVFGALLPKRAYEKWAEMDQYGMILVVVFLVVLWGPFGRFLRWAVLGIANAFLG